MIPLRRDIIMEGIFMVISLFMHSPMQRKYAVKAAHGARGE